MSDTHYIRGNEKNYIVKKCCGSCDYTTNTRERLNDHLRTIHNEQFKKSTAHRVYCCKLCNNESKSYFKSRQHQILNHSRY